MKSNSIGVARSHTYKRFDQDGNVIEIPKKSYDTEQSAIFAARRINSLGIDIHKVVAYKCSKCGKWHIGHNNTIMTSRRIEKEREKLK